MRAPSKPKPGQSMADFLARLSRDQYERYLKRHGYRGLAAVRMDAERREGFKGLDTTTLLLS